MPTPILFYAPHSSYCQRVLIALHLKGVNWQMQEIDLFDKDQRTQYLTINPFGKIPALQLSNGDILYESIVILEYLETHYPNTTPLIPADPKQALYARFYERLIDIYINMPRNQLLEQQRQSTYNEKTIQKAKETITTACTLLNRQVQRYLWLAGDSCTIADCAALPVLNMLQMVFDLSAYPVLSNYLARTNQSHGFYQVWRAGLPKLRQLLDEAGLSVLMEGIAVFQE